MRLLTFLLSIAVLFALADPVLSQSRYSPAEAPVAQPAKVPRLRMLTWPGKVQPAATVQAAAAAPAPRPISSPTPAAPPAPAKAALPTSIYDPAPPAPAAAAAPKVQALAQAAPAAQPYPRARTYSVHRQYGETPDPVALTPRFFDEASPDLAEPPPPAPRTFTTTGGRVVRAAPTPAAPE